MAETWLRVATYTPAGSGSEDFLNYMESSVQSVVTRLEKQPGFRGGHWGHDPASGGVAAVTHWSSRTAIENAARVFDAVAADRSAHGVRASSTANLRLFTNPTSWSAGDWAAIMGGKAANWLRVVLYRPEGPADECVDYLRSSTQEAVRILERLPGFRTGYWGHDPVDGTMAAVTYWDSEDAIANATPELDRLHQERKAHGIQTDTVVNLRLLPAPTHMVEPQGWLS